MKLVDAERYGELYPDRHLNVFVPFESHDLDYNVTRALIATLRWSRPELTQAFLKDVVGLEPKDGAYHFDMGGCDYTDFDPADVERKVVLGISVGGKIAENLPSLDDVNQEAIEAIVAAPVALPVKLGEVRRLLARPELDLDDLACLAHTLDELADGSLPDGWIFSAAASTCVLIEAKLLEYLDRYQLDRYSEVFFGRARADGEELVLKTWEDVAGFFRGYAGDADVRTAFLCGQLVDYLDLLGLAPFHGFRPYDFDPDAAQEALGKFYRFAEAVHDRATAAGLPLGDLRPSPTGARIGLADAALPGELCLDLLEAGVRIEHRSGDTPTGRLAGRASVDRILAGSEGGAKNPLEGVTPGAGLHVRVDRLKAPSSDGPAHVERETLREELDPAGFALVLEELRRQHPPAEQSRDMAGGYRRGALSIGRTIDRHEAVGSGDGEPVLEQTVAALGELVKLARQLVPDATPVAG